MSAQRNNQHLLPWYVSGKLSPEERHDLDRHLVTCPECRAEAAALASMMKSLRSQSRMDHVAPAELVAFEEESSTLPLPKRASIENHLAECAGCREDLERLRQARSDEGALETKSRDPRRWPARAAWVAAAAAALLVLVALPRAFHSAQRKSSSGDASFVVFPAPRRGGEPPPALSGPGPWSLRVVLPFGAAPGTYRIRLRFASDPLPLLETAANADADQGLRLFLPELHKAGRYELFLAHDPPTSEDEYPYFFEYSPRPIAKPGK